jgi:Ni,Fe-hydrogenase III large subunit
VFGHRYLMDAIVPGGVARDIAQGAMAQILLEADQFEKSVALQEYLR